MKTKLFFLFAFLTFWKIEAQVVQFEDLVFKNYLLQSSAFSRIAVDSAGNQIKIDANNDKEIQKSEAQNVAKLFVYLGFPNNLTSLKGLEQFSNLTEFKGGSFTVNSIDFSGLSFLRVVNIYSSNFKELKLEQCSNLLVLDIGGNYQNPLSSLNLSSCNLLQKLNVNSNSLTSLDLSNLSNLTEIDCGYNPITEINFSPSKKIKKIIANDCQISQISVNGLADLTYLDISNLSTQDYHNVYQAIDLSTNPKLEDVRVSSVNELLSINVSNKAYLKRLDIGFNTKLVEIIANNCPLLYQGSYLTGGEYFDFTQCSSLKKVNFENCSSLLNIYSNAAPIEELNINNCTSLFKLYLSQTKLNSFNYNNIPALKILEIAAENGTLTNFDFSSFSKLETLSIRNCSGILMVKATDNPLLNKAIIQSNTNLLNTDISNCPSIEYLNVDYNTALTTLNLENSKQNLLEFYGNNGSLQTINLEGATQLTKANLSNNKLIMINIKNCMNLESLYCDYNSLQSFHTNKSDRLDKLATLILSKNKITDIYMSDLPLLKNLSLSQNSLVKAYFYNIPQITSLGLFSNPTLQEVSIKDGIKNTTAISLDSNLPQFKFFCKDESDVVTGNPYNITEYCTYFPGGFNNKIMGDVKLDTDKNGCDATDADFSNLKINISETSSGNPIITSYSESNGAYKIYLGKGNFTIAPQVNPDYFIITPTSTQINFENADNNTSAQNFCIVPNGTHRDLEIQLIPISQARPGFEATYRMIYLNKGNTTLSGKVYLDYPGSKIQFVSSEIPVDVNQTSYLDWNFTNLKPFEQKSFILTFKLNPPTHPTNPLNNGDKLIFKSVILPILQDETPLDNLLYLRQNVVNSFDPNDKTCLEGDTVNEDMAGKDVHYLIRFENTGTAKAENIVIKDMIDTNKFEIETLQPIRASHPYRMTITEGNKVEFFFENIQLPFPPSSERHGYILFKIKTKSNLKVGDTFSNKADIHFDYNFPLETNNFLTTVETALATQEVAKSEISVFPNPVKDIINFKTTEKIIKTELFDTSGRLLKTFLGVENNQINLAGIKKGNYILNIYTKEKISTQKIIKE